MKNKVVITGKTSSILFLVKWVKQTSKLGLKEAKLLVDESLSIGKPLILEVDNCKKVIDSFNYECQSIGLTIKKHRSDVIRDFLKKNDESYDFTKEKDYQKILNIFNDLYKNDKEHLEDLFSLYLD